MADVMGKRVSTLASQEGSAYGAALLAAVGTGAYGSVEEACATAIHEAEKTEPDAGAAADYARYHTVYRAIYPALKPIYGQL